jgi:hypothetical protein
MNLLRIGKLFALIGFIYQLIDSTITYTKFEIVFNIQEDGVNKDLRSITSISFCIDSYQQFLRIKNEKRKEESIG